MAGAPRKIQKNSTISIRYGGQRGIRTLDTLSRIHAFQACAFNHSATCPSFCSRRSIRLDGEKRSFSASPVKPGDGRDIYR